MKQTGAWVSCGLVVLLLGACGGSSDAGLSGTGGQAGSAGSISAGGSAGTATGGSSGQGGSGAVGTAGSGGGSGYPLDSVCQTISAKGCELEQPCCVSSGFGFDAAQCTARAVIDCQKNVAEVQANTMTYDPTQIDACLAALGQAFQKCTLDVGEWYATLDAIRPCSFVFAGQRPEGAECERDAQCAPSSDPNVFVSCSDTTKKCVSSRRLGLGDACAVGDAVLDFCGAGLFCDASLLGLPPYQGMCKTATPEGAKCNNLKPYDLECGAGFYCNKSTAVCTKAKVGGASCTETLECQTFQCTLGKCTAQAPLVTQQDCTG